MKQVIISGINGFVGANLKSYLKKDFSIIGVSRTKDEKKGIIDYTELSKEVLDASEAFVHLAGKAHDLKKVSTDNDYFEANTELTKKIFDMFLESKCKTFIFVSSVKAAADTVEGILDEDIKPTPKTAYGMSKLAAEEYLLSCNVQDKNIYILRPCMIYGLGNKGNLNLLYSFIQKGIPYPLGAYKNQRSFLSVENLCFTIQNFIIDKFPSEIYNVSDDDPVSTLDLIKIISDVLDKKVRIISIPKFVVYFAAKLGDLLSLPLNTERLSKLTGNYIVSNKKLKRTLGKELPMTSQKGLYQTIQSLKDE